MLQSFKLAIKAILSNKIRSLLTMLGIIIGVAAVIILVSIVAGYMGEMVKQFEEMGVNKITVFCRNMSTRRMDDNDMYSFWDEHPEWLSGLSPNVSLSNAKIKSGSENLDSTTINGVSEDYLEIENTNPGCEMIIESIEYFMNKSFKSGLTVLDKIFTKEYSRYENKIHEIENKIENID